MREQILYYRKTTDWTYLVLCGCLSAISVIVLISIAEFGGINYGTQWGNYQPAITQGIATVMGLLGAVAISLPDYRLLLRLWPLHAGLCWGLVLLTFVPGIGYEPAGTGSQSWIALPFGMSFQPTELAKVSFCLTFALHLEKVHRHVNRIGTLAGLALHLAAPVLLIHLQGDDGGALVFLVMGVAMLVMAGLNRWVVAGGALVALASLPLLWRFVLTNHQKSRILGLLDPEPLADTIMFQQLRSRTAIGWGGIFGRGLFNEGHVYVPLSQNDFMFSYFAGSCGLIGCLMLLLILFAVIMKTLFTAVQAPDAAGTFLCVGIFGAMFFQTVINVGMNLMLLPVMGVTLPFLSAGGSSVLMLYLSIGLVLGVGRRKDHTISHAKSA